MLSLCCIRRASTHPIYLKYSGDLRGGGEALPGTEPLDFHNVLVLGLSLQRKKVLPFEIENGMLI